ncbi:MAG: hypothetical protein JWM32_64 [Verrucomicrobia bacterium]|nr:hypothetical protein [Verrucomicrobiota bacterium]
MPPRRRGLRAAFTLVELLTVMSIIGILVAILIPTTSAVRVSARRARTKVQFSQWALAMELFRQEYGFFPAIDAGTGKVDSKLFSAALTGRLLDGSVPADAASFAGNAKGAAFYSIAEGELDETRRLIVDAFGNSDIAVLYDRNGDGRITALDGAPRGVGRGNGAGPANFLPASSDLDLTAGIRAGVIFYSAGQGDQQSDLVLSWK